MCFHCVFNFWNLKVICLPAGKGILVSVSKLLSSPSTGSFLPHLVFPRGLNYAGESPLYCPQSVTEASAQQEPSQWTDLDTLCLQPGVFFNFTVCFST